MPGQIHYRSTRFIPTTRDAPADATQPSHRYMLRAGLIRQLGSGAYTKLPLGFTVCRNLENLIDEEMELRGAVRLHFPALQPVSIWQDAGRFEAYGKDMFSFKDRHERLTCMAPTHEIAAALMAASDIRSYKDLPRRIYQTQTKFRDEVRPRAGLLRTREFTMHDVYSFDVDEAAGEASYSLFHAAYVSLFRRLELPVYSIATSDTGAIGGSVSHEFLHPNPGGDSEFFISADGSRAQWEPDESDPSNSVKHAGFELAHTFQLGTQYSVSLGTFYDTPSGEKWPIWMCSFGLGIERTIASLIEHHSSGGRMVWPAAVAPYHVNIVLAQDDVLAIQKAGADIAARLASAGLRVMIDDRPARVGVKFADSELLGAAQDVVLGKDYPSAELQDHRHGTRRSFDVQEVAAQVCLAHVTDS